MTRGPLDVAAVAAMLGIAIPPDRALAIAAELARLAGRMEEAPLRLVPDDVPADFVRALR